jgi:hypothetical protein
LENITVAYFELHSVAAPHKPHSQTTYHSTIRRKQVIKCNTYIYWRPKSSSKSRGVNFLHFKLLTGEEWDRNVMPVYIRVSVVLSWHYSRKESDTLDINLDSTVFVFRV